MKFVEFHLFNLQTDKTHIKYTNTLSEQHNLCDLEAL
jgi:hypothetical protein